MTIDYTTVRLYTCCKCGHKWTNWDRLKQRDSETLPGNCPHCRNIRWNQHYSNDDMELIYQVMAQHMVKFKAESHKNVLAEMVRKMKGEPEPEELIEEDLIYIHYFDFIAYDFLYKMIPMPDVFELKQVLALPEEDIETRHKLMLSMINDRVTNQEKYRKDYFGRLLKDEHEHIHDKANKYPGYEFKGGSKKRRKMPGCKHKEHSLEVLIALYTEPSYRLPWYYRQYPFEMHEFEQLPGEHSKAIYEKLKAEVQRIHETELQEDYRNPELRRAINEFEKRYRKEQYEEELEELKTRYDALEIEAESSNSSKK